MATLPGDASLATLNSGVAAPAPSSSLPAQAAVPSSRAHAPLRAPPDTAGDTEMEGEQYDSSYTHNASAVAAAAPSAAAAASAAPAAAAAAGSSASGAATELEQHAGRLSSAHLGDADSIDVLDVELDAALNAAAADLDTSSRSSALSVSDVEDDDELTILEVRRALHIPLHPTRHPHHQVQKRRIVHSPVNLLDDDEEVGAAAGGSVSASAAAPTPSASPTTSDDDDEADVCAICLGEPTDLCVPSACTHPFCYPCLEQWTKIQLASIYRAQEEAQTQAVLQGFVAAGSSSGKKTHPSCPLCKRDYTALRRPMAPSAAAASKPFDAATLYEFIPISQILPPPNTFQPQPTLQITNRDYMSNEYFRLAGEAALQFAMRASPGLRPELIRNLLENHPRVRALLCLHPPYRDRLPAVRSDLITQVIATRQAHLRRLSAAEIVQQQHRRRAQAVDHGDGELHFPEPVPMMHGGNAHQQLVNRMSPYGSASLLSLAFGVQNNPEPVYIPTNPILQLYRESRYHGGITHYLGRMRLWSDLRVQYIPAQPDVIWALRVNDVGTGRQPFAEQQPPRSRNAATADAPVPPAFAASAAAAAAAANTAAGSGGAAAAAAASSSSSPALPTLTSWLDTELTSLLSVRHDSVTPDQHEHFLVNLVLSYLELLMDKLVLEEKARQVELEQRRKKQATNNKRKRNEAGTPAAAAAASAPSSLNAAPIAAASSAPSSTLSLPSLASSFVPSYASASSSLHPMPEGAPTQLLGAEEAARADDNGDVVVVSSSSAAPTAAASAAAPSPAASPASSPRPDVISLDDDDDEEEVTAVTGATDPETAALLRSASSSGDSATPRSLREGGHMHSLFAFSAPLSTSVEFLFAKLEEFLRGFTGVFVHRLLLFILSRAYNAPGAAPAPGDPRAVVTPQQAAARARREQDLEAALQAAREQWRISRNLAARGPEAAAPTSSRRRNRASTASPASDNSASRDAPSVSERLAARRKQRAADQAGSVSAAGASASASGAGEGERKDGQSRSRRRRSPALSSGFIASVFGGAAAASSSGTAAAEVAHANSHRASPSLSSGASSPAPSSADTSAVAAAAMSPPSYSDPAASARERQYLDADAMLLSGMHSSKRPRRDPNNPQAV